MTEERASILVVDDNPLIVNVLNSLLSSENYNVYSSGNGKEARAILEKKSIDVIICDVMMPEMDGYAFHDFVRSCSEYSHIPFLFLTALGSNDEINRGNESGADDYLLKPFDPRQLLTLVKGKVLRSRKLKNLSEERYETFRKRVIHTLSHEFRTPLVAINTGTELLLDQEGSAISPRAQSLIAAIQRGGRRLERLVTDFMLLQQFEAGIPQRLYEARAVVTLISDLVEGFAESKRRELEEQGFLLTAKCLSKGCKAKVYEPQAYGILERLVGNAVKFSKDEKCVEIIAYPRAGQAVIEVRDRGIGLDIDRAKEAVDVFGQLDRERMEQQGSGLGLAIASRYALIHQGTLEFARRPGGGSVVSFVLPLAAQMQAGHEIDGASRERQ